MSGEVPSTSATLIRRLRNFRDEAAWRTFLERYTPLIENWSRHHDLRAADREEIRDRVLARLANALPSFEYDPDRSFRAWLCTVVRNVVRDYWAELERRPGARGQGGSEVRGQLEQQADLAEELGSSVDEDLRRAEQAMARVRARVAPPTWQCFWLTVVEGKPSPEVAAELKLTLVAVYQNKNRVAKMLRSEGAALLEPAPPCEGPP
jgi:RNA polymerase sigma-70 factor (ECF subfamily)